MPKDDPAAFALMTVEIKESVPSIGAAVARLGVAIEDVDTEFGVVPIDALRGIYSVRVRADRLAKSPEGQKAYQGPFSDPPIASFGPAKDQPKK